MELRCGLIVLLCLITLKLLLLLYQIFLSDLFQKAIWLFDLNTGRFWKVIHGALGIIDFF